VQEQKKSESKNKSFPKMGLRLNQDGANGRKRRSIFGGPDTEEAGTKIEEMIATKNIAVSIEGAEIRGETRCEHRQGYTEFVQPNNLRQLKTFINEQMHWEIAQADKETNIRYCSKQDNGFSEINAFRKEKEKTQTKRPFWIQIPEDAQMMTPQKFQETHLDQWIFWRAAIEPTMMESASMRAKTWNGRLHAKNIWFCGEQMGSHKTSNKNRNK
jgi:hypothetical protein